VEPKIEPCALAEIFDEIREQQIDAAELKGLAFPVSACGLTILSDPNLLRTVLHNLVGNAVKYTKAGQVRLDGRIEGDHAVIEVSDTGPGIPADKLRLIFDEFQQLDIEHAGVGLGLAIAKRTADLLGHALTVRSTLGAGATFAVSVPLAPSPDQSR
jgi:two-component system, sensor histidine kinase